MGIIEYAVGIVAFAIFIFLVFELGEILDKRNKRIETVSRNETQQAEAAARAEEAKVRQEELRTERLRLETRSRTDA